MSGKIKVFIWFVLSSFLMFFVNLTVAPPVNQVRVNLPQHKLLRTQPTLRHLLVFAASTSEGVFTELVCAVYFSTWQLEGLPLRASWRESSR